VLIVMPHHVHAGTIAGGSRVIAEAERRARPYVLAAAVLVLMTVAAAMPLLLPPGGQQPARTADLSMYDHLLGRDGDWYIAWGTWRDQDMLCVSLARISDSGCLAWHRDFVDRLHIEVFTASFTGGAVLVALGLADTGTMPALVIDGKTGGIAFSVDAGALSFGEFENVTIHMHAVTGIAYEHPNVTIAGLHHAGVVSITLSLEAHFHVNGTLLWSECGPYHGP